MKAMITMSLDTRVSLGALLGAWLNVGAVLVGYIRASMCDLTDELKGDSGAKTKSCADTSIIASRASMSGSMCRSGGGYARDHWAEPRTAPSNTVSSN